MSHTESPAISARIAKIEAVTGKQVILRATRLRNSLFRGRITERAAHILLEYRDNVSGFFWHYEIIEELLGHVESGRTNAALYEGDVQYADAPTKPPCPCPESDRAPT